MGAQRVFLQERNTWEDIEYNDGIFLKVRRNMQRIIKTVCQWSNTVFLLIGIIFGLGVSWAGIKNDQEKLREKDVQIEARLSSLEDYTRSTTGTLSEMNANIAGINATLKMMNDRGGR